MATLNKVMLIGNLTKDPESRAAGQHTIASFSIAVNRRSKGQDGQAKEDVSYFDCEAWNKTGELVMQYLKKGRTVLVEGRLQQDRWEAADGQKRNKVKIVADNVQFLSPKAEGEGSHEPAGAGIGDPNEPF
jgi:single-strand DNA-binding protein